MEACTLKTPITYILFAQKFSVVWYLNSIRYLNFQPAQYTLSRQFCPVKLKTCKSFRKNCFIFYCPWPCICPVFSPFFRKQRNSLHSLSQRHSFYLVHSGLSKDGSKKRPMVTPMTALRQAKCSLAWAQTHKLSKMDLLLMSPCSSSPPASLLAASSFYAPTVCLLVSLL